MKGGKPSKIKREQQRKRKNRDERGRKERNQNQIEIKLVYLLSQTKLVSCSFPTPHHETIDRGETGNRSCEAFKHKTGSHNMTRREERVIQVLEQVQY